MKASYSQHNLRTSAWIWEGFIYGRGDLVKSKDFGEVYRYALDSFQSRLEIRREDLQPTYSRVSHEFVKSQKLCSYVFKFGLDSNW